MCCYKEMTSRDLVQRRSTNERGETVWQDTQLVRSAKEGGVCVIDGIDRLSEGLLSSLQRIVIDRELLGGSHRSSDSIKPNKTPSFA